MLKLFTDTGMDIIPELTEKYNYNLISIPYTLNGETIYPYKSAPFDSHDFYEKLRNGALPTTSSLNNQQLRAYFEPVLDAGDDVLYVHFSSTMTGMFSRLEKLKLTLESEYPGRKLYLLDSKTVSAAGLNFALEIRKLVESNLEIDEILKAGKELRNHITQYFFINDLKFLQKSGRATALEGTVGTLLGIRPVIFIDNSGNVASVGKERGASKAIEKILEKVAELSENLENHNLILSSADSTDYLNKLESNLIKRFGNSLNIIKTTMSPTIGVHCGPSATGLSFYSKTR